jgi:hypothetical protein
MLWKLAAAMLAALLLVCATGCPKCPDCRTIHLTRACSLPEAPRFPRLTSAAETDGGALRLSKKDALLLQGYLYRIKGWVVQAAECGRVPADGGSG